MALKILRFIKSKVKTIYKIRIIWAGRVHYFSTKVMPRVRIKLRAINVLLYCWPQVANKNEANEGRLEATTAFRLCQGWLYKKEINIMMFYSFNHSFKVLSTTYLTLRSYSPLFSWNIWAATLLAGERGLGSQSKDLIDVSTAHTSYTGDHWLAKTKIKMEVLSKQMRPSL